MLSEAQVVQDRGAGPDLYGSASQAGVWATDKLIQAGGAWSIKIPSSIKAGGYVVRNELLALHDQNNPQFYPQCANFQITGGGSAIPSGVEGNALYSLDEPGVLYNIYEDQKKPIYKIPGPALFTG
ncbi:lytic polysaccharide monooxygenase [Lophiostoma macrostomum CBS 122681]|uniref:lytic cellulose monooxygenase (C4-dehydrogenating) n=1 Tax=Lophiostoma macrostomum CBS 122681 TaxID=1314788 RepID=A0A6A6SHX8_9PLEO|nr:lytic polysaccharide monooxygenase [Lophiostoma macrostomum CBS 122681]